MVLHMKFFSFPLPAKVFVRLSLVFLAVTSATPALAQSRLPEVVVTATRFAEPAAMLPFGVSVLTADDIQSSGASTVNEAVMKLLGVVGRIDTSGGTNYSLDLRGFGATAGSNQIVIVDGLRLTKPTSALLACPRFRLLRWSVSKCCAARERSFTARVPLAV